MFTTIVLLTGSVERSHLAPLLERHNARLKIVAVSTLAELAALSAGLLKQARLVGFATEVVVPAGILHMLGFGAYNFHPGSPSYPGWQPEAFAVYDRAPVFGATAHVMVERVDSGPIIGYELFDVPPDTDVGRLSAMAYSALARLFWRFAPALATQGSPLAELPIGWRGRKTSRRVFGAMCDIPLDIAAEELTRRVAAFGTGDGRSRPTVTLHGFRFQLTRTGDQNDQEER